MTDPRSDGRPDRDDGSERESPTEPVDDLSRIAERRERLAAALDGAELSVLRRIATGLWQSTGWTLEQTDRRDTLLARREADDDPQLLVLRLADGTHAADAVLVRETSEQMQTLAADGAVVIAATAFSDYAVTVADAHGIDLVDTDALAVSLIDDDA